MLIRYAMTFIGTRYLFGTAPSGGDDPGAGFDCSGFASELLRAAGVLKYRDRLNAQGIYAHLRTGGEICEPRAGAFSFYGKSATEISHVGFCIAPGYMIEAGGGDETTLDTTTAARQNAFTRIRPVRFRRDFVACVMPAYPIAPTGVVT